MYKLEFDEYEIMLTLIRGMLATNPADPNVMDQFVINRQRDLILEKSKINNVINKYMDQMQISKEKGDGELSKLVDSLEKITDMELTEEERAKIIAGGLEALKETFKKN